MKKAAAGLGAWFGLSKALPGFDGAQRGAPGEQAVTRHTVAVSHPVTFLVFWGLGYDMWAPCRQENYRLGFYAVAYATPIWGCGEAYACSPGSA